MAAERIERASPHTALDVHLEQAVRLSFHAIRGQEAACRLAGEVKITMELRARGDEGFKVFASSDKLIATLITERQCCVWRIDFAAIGTISLNIQASSSSIPNFLPIFEKALQEYKKKTGKDLTTHPLATEIESCRSPDAILTVLQWKADELNQSRNSDERLTKWLNPTVNILNALSATPGEGAGSVSRPPRFALPVFALTLTLRYSVTVFPPTKIIISGISILLVVSFAQSSAWVVNQVTISIARGGEEEGDARQQGEQVALGYRRLR
ncbi:hypothetical protein EDB85DRAFT_2144696 [Lactarius pseudohatsudake]|nr:hypothetical protein EDB85DRAFT_2144696 [Lactarius pseudohatsudake]